MSFSEFHLRPELQRAIEALQFSVPTPVQKAAIPAALQGNDLMVSAQTGTGKTLAFLLPALHRILSGPLPIAAPGDHRSSGHALARPPSGHATASPSVLVLLPTRELAAQVASVARDLTRFAPVRSSLVVGGESFGRQARELAGRTALVLATPGRLLDHLQRRSVSLSGVRTLVLDEADRMLDMGFAPALRAILQHVPAERQTMLFSATLPKEIAQLGHLALRHPLRLNMAPEGRPAESIAQFAYPVPMHQKNDLLLEILRGPTIHSVLIFCRTKRRADKLARFLLAADLTAVAMHSDRSQAQRTAALHGFKTGRFKVLVATNVAARGIDVKKLSHVINYDVPQHREDYVHRVGRTGRHTEVGDALTLVSPEEASDLAVIERFIGRALPRVQIPGFPYDKRGFSAPAGSPGFRQAAGRRGFR
jgi:ATP-dependent RNA helicase RhlE